MTPNVATAVAVAAAASRASFLTLAFSGAGRLLPYHLGASASLLRRLARAMAEENPRPRGGGGLLQSPTASHSPPTPVRAVSGSSSGSIAAVLFARLPHRLDEYTERFIEERGRGFLRILGEMLREEEECGAGPTSPADPRQERQRQPPPPPPWVPPSLHIAATRCSDGAVEIFSFPPSSSTHEHRCSSSDADDVDDGDTAAETDRILQCVRASCTISKWSHLLDLVTPRALHRYHLPYDDAEGIFIDGRSYIDGGIAAPAPPTPHDAETGAFRVVVSPISVCEPSPPRSAMITPSDGTVNLLPFDGRFVLPGEFRVRPSWQNLCALKVSIGAGAKLTPPTEAEMRDWYWRGEEDGERMAERLWAERSDVDPGGLLSRGWLPSDTDVTSFCSAYM